MHPAAYAVSREDHILCELCPHLCRLKPGQTGRCRVRTNLQGTLMSLNYGKISALQIDPVEKKPLAHFMPGTKTFSIGSYGCNLRCPFCQNYHLSMETPTTQLILPEEMIKRAKKAGTPSISFTYNEPVVSYEYVEETSRLAHSQDLSTIMVTNGFICSKPLLKLLPLLDAMNIDLKAFNDNTYRTVCGGSLKPVQDTIRSAVESSVHVEVTLLLVTNMHQLNELEDMFKWLASISAEIPIHISRYFPVYRHHEPPTSIQWIHQVCHLAEKYLTYVHTGNV
jgi:pyruvate formate lyase activating enzyme